MLTPPVVMTQVGADELVLDDGRARRRVVADDADPVDLAPRPRGRPRSARSCWSRRSARAQRRPGRPARCRSTAPRPAAGAGPARGPARPRRACRSARGRGGSRRGGRPRRRARPRPPGGCRAAGGRRPGDRDPRRRRRSTRPARRRRRRPGIGAPVMIRALRPGRSRAAGVPAAMSPTTGSVTGASGRATSRRVRRSRPWPSCRTAAAARREDVLGQHARPSASSSSSSSGGSGRTAPGSRRGARRPISSRLSPLPAARNSRSQGRNSRRRGRARSQANWTDRAQIVELVTGVVAAAAEQHAVHRPPWSARVAGQRAQRVGELDLAARGPAGSSRSTSKTPGRARSGR